MNSLLHELQNNEAILLMYLANELPALDRQEVEHMLDRDDKLRLELTRIRDSYEGYHHTMRRMDAAMPPVSAFAAARAVGESVRRHQTEPESLDEHEERKHRIHWALYPIAAAAALLIGMFMWWQSARGDMDGPPLMATTDRGFGRGEGRFRGDFEPEIADPAAVSDAQIMRMFDPIVPDRGFESQRQLTALQYLNQSLQ